MAKVSVIVPIYQVEKYLDRSIQSIQNQELRDIQIILVDDGSTDRCPSICDEYAKEDDRILVIHKENGGLSSARNAGMCSACGDYVFFVDSDDWIEPETLRELVQKIEKTGADFVRFRPMTANWPGKQDGSLVDFGTEKCLKAGIYDRKMIEETILPRLFATPQLQLGVIVSAWRSLYRRDFLISNNLFFKEDIRYSEDTIFSANVVMNTNQFIYLDGARYYHYFYNPDSITKSYRDGRWENYKRLMAYFDQDFSDFKDFDFHDQLCLQKLYCIASAVTECRKIRNVEEKKKKVKTIVLDPVTREACKHLNLLHVSWKMSIMFRLIKWKALHIITLILH